MLLAESTDTIYEYVVVVTLRHTQIVGNALSQEKESSFSIGQGPVSIVYRGFVKKHRYFEKRVICKLSDAANI